MPDHCRQRPRSCRSVRLARTRTANLVVHRPIHRFVPTPTTVLRAKAIASTAPARPPSDQRRGQFPIALAAPSVPYPPRFRALALFRRRPPERVVGIVGAGVRKPAHKRALLGCPTNHCVCTLPQDDRPTGALRQLSTNGEIEGC